jgi:hypothetical protein
MGGAPPIPDDELLLLELEDDDDEETCARPLELDTLAPGPEPPAPPSPG